MGLQQTSIHQEKHRSKIFAKPKTLLLIIGIILIGANLRAPLTSVGPLVGTIRESLGISNAVAGTLTTIPLIAFALFSPFAPKLSRRFGMEKVLFLSLIAIASGIMLRFLVGVSYLFIGTVLIGLGIAVCNVLIPSVVKEKFPHNLGMMTGVYAVSMNICAAISSGLSVPMSLKYGWHGSLGYWSIFTLIAIIFWIPQMQVRQTSKGANVSKQESVNVWKSSLAWKVTLFMGFQSFMFYTFIAWIPAILSQYGVSTNSAGWMLSYMQFAVIPFTFIVPILAGRMKSQRPIVLVISLMFIIGALGLLYGNMTLIYISVIILGIASGSSFSLSMIFFSLRTENAQQAANLSGMAQSIGYLLAALGPAMFGILHDMYNNWNLSLYMLIIVSFLILFFGLEAGKNKTISNR